MRQSCHWVTTSCAAPLTPAKKYVAVHLLSKEILYSIVEVKGKVQHVFDQLCSYLGLKDAELFGLALLLDNEYLFLDFNIKLSKLVSKSWKSQSNNGLDSIGRPLLSLHLGIQYYVDCPMLVRDKQTRHHYYLQVKGNFIQHCQVCSEERCFLMAAYALQADYGNFRHDKHVGRYFEPRDYFPPWILNRLGDAYMVQNAPKIHKDYLGYSKGEAEMAFIREASSPDAPHNLHIYKLKKKKNDLLGSVWLGICSRGIEIYESGGVNSPTKKLMVTFLWADIGKLCFEKKKFEIRVASYADTRKYTYYTGSDEKSKHLLYLCKATHQFNLVIQPRVTEFKRFEMEEKKSYRESYIYSDSLDLEWEQEHGTQLDMSLHDFSTLSRKVTKIPCDQRTSVISNASSNTTSGIVSDRVQSLDGSEDEMDSAREPDSPLPPADQPIEALNLTVITCLGGLVNRHDDTKATVASTKSQSPAAQTTAHQHQTNGVDEHHESAADSAHSSGSERSVSTVRSKLAAAAAALAPSSSSTTDHRHRALTIGYSTVTVAAAAPTPSTLSSVSPVSSNAVKHFSESASDTCSSSFDHSYASSVDSTTAHAAYLNGGSGVNGFSAAPWHPLHHHQHAAAAAITNESNSKWSGSNHRVSSTEDVGFSSSTSTNSALNIPACISPASSTVSSTSLRPMHPPPVPVRTDASTSGSIYSGRAGGGVLTNTSIRSTPSCSPQSSNDETNVNYFSAPGMVGVGGYTYPPTCLPGGRAAGGVGATRLANGFHPLPPTHCRTKIGVSSLSRNANGGYGVGSYNRLHHQRPLSLHSPSSAHQHQYGPQSAARYAYGAHSNLVTLGKSISVPNVINEHECLSPGFGGFGGLGSSVATYPQMAMARHHYNHNYACSDARLTSVPTYPRLVEEQGMMSATPQTPASYQQAEVQWLSMPSAADYYATGSSYPELTTIPPPNEFATYIPPPPPYRTPQKNNDEAVGFAQSAVMTPPPGFRHEQSPPPPPPVRSSELSIGGAQPPPLRPRTLLLPTRAVSEENILLSNQHQQSHTLGFPMLNFLLGNSASSVQLNGYHSEDGCDERVATNPTSSPPPYCFEISPVVSSPRIGPTELGTPPATSPGSPGSANSRSQEEGLDFQTLKERSKDLDLPLITALCNDRSLIPVSNACGHQHTGGATTTTDVRRLSCCAPVTISANTTSTGRPLSWHVDSTRQIFDSNGSPLSLISGAPWYPRQNTTVGAATSLATTSTHANGVVLPPTALTKWASTTAVPPQTTTLLSPSAAVSTNFATASVHGSSNIALPPSYGMWPVTTPTTQHNMMATISNGYANVASLH